MPSSREAEKGRFYVVPALVRDTKNTTSAKSGASSDPVSSIAHEPVPCFMSGILFRTKSV